MTVGKRAAAYKYLLYVRWNTVRPRHTERLNNMFVAMAKIQRTIETNKHFERYFG